MRIYVDPMRLLVGLETRDMVEHSITRSGSRLILSLFHDHPSKLLEN